MRHLHPSIVDVITAAGYLVDDAESMRRMQAHHAYPGASRRDLAILTRRLDRPSDLDHARSEGRHHRPSGAVIELDRIVLRVIAPHLHEIPVWRSWHSADEVELVASRAGVHPSAVRLALQGIPGRQTDPALVERLDRASRLWRSGAPVPTVASEGFGHSTAWLHRARRTGRVALYPARLHRGDIAARAGVSITRVATWTRDGVLPEPDGDDGRPWWWEQTIITWMEDALPHRCPHCPARLPTLTGVRVHASKKHLRGVPPALTSSEAFLAAGPSDASET